MFLICFCKSTERTITPILEAFEELFRSNLPPRAEHILYPEQWPQWLFKRIQTPITSQRSDFICLNLAWIRTKNLFLYNVAHGQVDFYSNPCYDISRILIYLHINTGSRKCYCILPMTDLDQNILTKILFCILNWSPQNNEKFVRANRTDDDYFLKLYLRMPLQFFGFPW